MGVEYICDGEPKRREEGEAGEWLASVSRRVCSKHVGCSPLLGGPVPRTQPRRYWHWTRSVIHRNDASEGQVKDISSPSARRNLVYVNLLSQHSIRASQSDKDRLRR